MAERFSQKNLRVRPSSDEEKIVTNAKEHFEKTLVEISGEIVGSVAALTPFAIALGLPEPRFAITSKT